MATSLDNAVSIEHTKRIQNTCGSYITYRNIWGQSVASDKKYSLPYTVSPRGSSGPGNHRRGVKDVREKRAE